jgi:hypothetical protein
MRCSALLSLLWTRYSEDLVFKAVVCCHILAFFFKAVVCCGTNYHFYQDSCVLWHQLPLFLRPLCVMAPQPTIFLKAVGVLRPNVPFFSRPLVCYGTNYHFSQGRCCVMAPPSLFSRLLCVVAPTTIFIKAICVLWKNLAFFQGRCVLWHHPACCYGEAYYFLFRAQQNFGQHLAD